MATLRYMLHKVVPLRDSGKSGVVQVKKISWFKETVVARSCGGKLLEEATSTLTGLEGFHKRIFAGDCSNRHRGSGSRLISRSSYCAIFALYSPPNEVAKLEATLELTSGFYPYIFQLLAWEPRIWVRSLNERMPFTMIESRS